MSVAHYLIFGDLHGRILPAFSLAMLWERTHEIRLDGLLQVGDIGYFPDLSRLDKATARHAAEDPLELGACLVAEPNQEADRLFRAEMCPPSLWFTAGNHEDFEALGAQERSGDRRSPSFPVDAYCQVRCVRDGRVDTLPGSLRLGAVWGIDDRAPNCRRRTPERAHIRESSIASLAYTAFDVLLSHDGPRDAVLPDTGSESLGALIDERQPAFAFFGHYGSRYGRVETTSGPSQVYQLAGFELRRHGGCAEAGSVGLLKWEHGAGEFHYVDESWLRCFTRHNWRHV